MDPDDEVFSPQPPEGATTGPEDWGVSLNVVDVSVLVSVEGDGDEAVDEGRKFDRLAD